MQIVFSVVLPLNLIQLIFQPLIASFILLLCIAVIWLATCIQVGLQTFPILVSRSNQSNVVGFVLSNFAFVLVLSRFSIDNKSIMIGSLPFLYGSTMYTHQSTFASSFSPLLIACLIYSIPIAWREQFPLDESPCSSIWAFVTVTYDVFFTAVFFSRLCYNCAV